MKKLFLSVFLGFLMLGAVAADAPAAPRCKACNGWGKVDKTEKTYTKNHNKKTVTTKVPCPECDGTGYDYAVKITPADLAPYDLIGKPTAEVSTDKGTLYAPGKTTPKYLRINNRRYEVKFESFRQNGIVSNVVIFANTSAWEGAKTSEALKFWTEIFNAKNTPINVDKIPPDASGSTRIYSRWKSKDGYQLVDLELSRQELTIRYSVNPEKK